MTEKYKKENKIMFEEVKEIKKIIKIPRLHYKGIEDSDYQALKEQYDKY